MEMKKRNIIGIVPTLKISADVHLSKYFIESSYLDSMNRNKKCYLCTKMGCELIGNKQQGEKGILFSAKYVERFNQYEESLKQNQISIANIENQITSIVNEIVEKNIKEVREYYKIKCKTKSDISSYIKKRLGVLRAEDEYEQVKARVFLILGISKWEDLDMDNCKEIIPVIDESIEVIKKDRPQQIGLFE